MADSLFVRLFQKIAARFRFASGGFRNSFRRNFRVKVMRLVQLCPRRLRILGGPLLGGLIGLVGGVSGLFIGLLLGALLGELVSQSSADRKILAYFENPGARNFYEGEPGLAAWCALGILVASEGGEGFSASGEQAVKQVLLRAVNLFAGLSAEPFLIEHFSRLAWSRKERLNPDLLAESLAARRAPRGDAGILARGLSGLAGNDKARRLAREIRLAVDPAPEKEAEGGVQGPADPWKILGLAPGTPPREIKAHYRRLAKQFHPDELQILDENQREAAARAFMAIKEAYKEIAG